MSQIVRDSVTPRASVMMDLCGHIHRANLRQIAGTLYCNTGDWVESCTALMESPGGTLELLRWPRARHAALRSASAPWADAA